MTEDASVKLPVTVTKNPGRNAGYTAAYGQYPHDIEARGATAAEARANLAGALATAVKTVIEARPAFARDADGALWVAVPAADGGSRWWRVTADAARYNASSSSPAAEAFGGCVGMTIVPAR
jgi:hypothetical protein